MTVDASPVTRRRPLRRRRIALLALAALSSCLAGAGLVRALDQVPHVAPPRPMDVVAMRTLPVERLARIVAPETRAAPDASAAAVVEQVKAPRADASLDRSGRTAFADGYLALTPDFASADGTYDVVFHFHGNTELVEQSLAAAHIGAVFVPLNLGVGSGHYEDRFANAAALPEMLGRVQNAMEKRGLAHAKLGRVALMAWSAGYGAVLHILEHAELAERIDAVVLLDALHVGHGPGGSPPGPDQFAPYERFARWAMDGRKLFTITHSEIIPGGYLGVRESTDRLLARLGVLRYAAGEEPAMPDPSKVPSVLTVLTKARRIPLHPMTLAERGGLHVRGYGGDGPDAHMLHLLQMGSTALPDLVAWWSRDRQASP